MWTKRNDHAPKCRCVDIFDTCLKRIAFEKNSSLSILLSSLLFIFSFPIFFFMKTIYNNISLSCTLAFFYQSTLFSLSHCKTCWTMSMDNIGLKMRLLGTSNTMVTLTFFLWTKVILGQVQQPLPNFTGPWDDFMVHGVNKTLVT